jgi:hypothetical protein
MRRKQGEQWKHGEEKQGETWMPVLANFCHKRATYQTTANLSSIL